MKSYHVTVQREWLETGCTTIQAKDKDEARDIVTETLLSNDETIEWEGSNMTIQGDSVVDVKEEG